MIVDDGNILKAIRMRVGFDAEYNVRDMVWLGGEGV